MSEIASDSFKRDRDAENPAALMARDFHHPYTPYAIQETFMSTVYQVLDEGKIGILESPTGTVSGPFYTPSRGSTLLLGQLQTVSQRSAFRIKGKV